MNVKNLKIVFWVLLGLVAFTSHAQLEAGEAQLFLFTDRDYCASGDTVWFKVFLTNGLSEKGNVIHVQLDSPTNNLISTVLKKSQNQWAEGYVFVPDSLATGVYFLSAFLNSQRSNQNLEAGSKSLFVYNRFANDISEMKIPSGGQKIMSKNVGTGVEIKINRNEFLPREKVTVRVNCSEWNKQGIKNAVVKAAKIDELAAEAGGTFTVNLISRNPEIPSATEKDGFVINGKVTDSETGDPIAGVLVLLSIVAEPPYFDYSVSGEDGGFYFYLKNAEGVPNAVLQAVVENGREYSIQLGENYLMRSRSFPMVQKTLTPKQTDFISTVVNGSFLSRLFKNNYVVQSDSFYMPARFTIPFYGKPGDHVVPAEFIDLPDFREISRELLPGVQYREKDGEITFRLLNEIGEEFFDVEPLRLINGIPVFKNHLFTSLKSTEIDYVDVVKQQRMFGDLIFNGVLAVSLKDKSNLWLAQQTNIFQFPVQCLQADKIPLYIEKPNIGANIPDVRQVYFWKIMDTAAPETFDFFLSDITGKIEVSVEGINDKNEFEKYAKIIVVK